MKVRELLKMLEELTEEQKDFDIKLSVDFDSALDLDGARVFADPIPCLNPYHDTFFLLSLVESVNFDVPSEAVVNKKVAAFQRKTRKR